MFTNALEDDSWNKMLVRMHSGSSKVRYLEVFLLNVLNKSQMCSLYLGMRTFKKFISHQATHLFDFVVVVVVVFSFALLDVRKTENVFVRDVIGEFFSLIIKAQSTGSPLSDHKATHFFLPCEWLFSAIGRGQKREEAAADHAQNPFYILVCATLGVPCPETGLYFLCYR